MEGKELNKIRDKAEIILDKANELIRFCNMVDNSQIVLHKHSSLMNFNQITRQIHSINRKKVLIESLKKELAWIM